MKDELFADLLASAEEMVTKKVKGQQTRARPYFSEMDVKAIREATGLRQQDFAVAVGVSYNLVKSWETKRRQPTRTPRKLLLLFASESFHYQSIENNLKTGGTSPPVFLPSFVVPCARVTGTGSQARMESPPRSLVPSSSIPLWLSTIRCTIASLIPCR